MPNLPAHVGLAYQAAQRLGHPALDSSMGYFLLGSTVPDIRAITKGRRERYHFAELDFADVGDGARGLFGTHPQLRSNGHAPTRAFMAGYVTHLALDEAWIVEMYRPYFGDRTVFEDGAYGNVMDRAMQLELDRVSQADVAAAVPLLDQVSERVDVGFIPPETISDWHRWVIEFMQREFSWDRLRFMARRIAAGDGSHPAHTFAEEFLKDVPGSIRRLHAYVPPQELSSFRQRAVGALAAAVGDYLF